MSYYPSSTEKELKKLEKVLDRELYTNVLTQMDNWTYHIRLSILKKEDLNEYLKLKTAAMNENEPNIKKMQQIIDQRGIVIAETGMINNLFIDSLTLKTISMNGASFTTEGKLTIVDTQGTGFINKLNVLSLLTGNGNYYSNQLYFITVWFVGYNGTGTIAGQDKIGLPNKEIEVFKPFKSYTTQSVTQKDEDTGEKTTNTYTRTYIDRSNSKVYLNVTFTDVKCSAEKNKSTWVMNFVTDNSSALTPQEVCVLSDLPDINLKKGDQYLIDVTKTLVKNINEKIKNQMGKEAFAKAYFDENDPTSGTGDNVSCFDITIKNEFKEDLFTTIPSIKNKEISTSNIKNAIGILQGKSYTTTSVNTSIPKDFNLKFDSKKNILDVYKTIIGEANSVKNDITTTPRITVFNKPMNIYNGKRYYHTFITIWLEYTPGFDICIDGVNDQKKLRKIEETQVDFMKQKPEHKNMFIRKYEWMTGNNKNGLLSYDSNKNNIWYLNSGLADKESAAHNTLNEQARTMSYEDPHLKKPVYQKEEKNKNNNESSFLPDGIKNINDAWEYAKQTNFIETLPLFPISIKDSNIGANDSVSVSPGDIQDNVNRAAYRIGYQNLISSGNALTIKLNIIGDPIWLDLGAAVLPDDIKTSLNLMILFKENTTFNLNDIDNYEADPLLQSCIPYQITTITSDFCNGAFNQTLEGNTPVTFLFDKFSIDYLTNTNTITNISNKKATDNTSQATQTNSVSTYAK